MTKKAQEDFNAVDLHTQNIKSIAHGWQIVNQLVQSANLTSADLRCVILALGLTTYLDEKAER